MAKALVTKDMLIGDIVDKYPISAMIMMKFGLHCIGCHVSAHESLADGCKGHGLEEPDIEELVAEINKAIDEEAKKKK